MAYGRVNIAGNNGSKLNLKSPVKPGDLKKKTEYGDLEGVDFYRDRAVYIDKENNINFIQYSNQKLLKSVANPYDNFGLREILRVRMGVGVAGIYSIPQDDYHYYDLDGNKMDIDFNPKYYKVINIDYNNLQLVNYHVLQLSTGNILDPNWNKIFSVEDGNKALILFQQKDIITYFVATGHGQSSTEIESDTGVIIQFYKGKILLELEVELPLRSINYL